MYYPILRGRQNELLAIKELLNASCLSEKIVPIIEPVKLSPTLVNTMKTFTEHRHDLALIQNPKVGSFFIDAGNSKNVKYLESYQEGKEKDNILTGIIVDNDIINMTDELHKKGINDDKIISICSNPDFIKYYENAFGTSSSVKTIVPYASAFRRIRNNRILLEDKFNKKPRNQDYVDNQDEFFSNDHIYYENDGYIGFSDYSIIGEEYSESGFAPYAVAIHIVYPDKNNDNEMRIHHFVSKDNDDYSDTANKFYQALEQLVDWNKNQKLDTIAIKTFERIYAEQSYPGLGVVKKLSIMHHLELMGDYLDSKIK